MATASVLVQSSAEEEIAGATLLAPPVFCGSHSRSNSIHHHHHHQQQQQQQQYKNNAVMDPYGGGDNLACEDRRCFACSSLNSLLFDWRAGDLVCTSCGVVQQGHLMESQPEWREYNDDNDGGAAAAAARSGLVPDDATKWLGGLQPTTLSRSIYGGAASTAVQTSICGMTTTDGTSTKDKKRSSSSASSRGGGGNVRKLLLKINHKIDRRMEKMHSSALQNAKLSTLIRKRALQRRRRRMVNSNGDTTCDDDETDDDESNNQDDGVHLDHEQLILQEEQDALAATSALYSDKWSLERAIRLFGSDHEQQQQPSTNSTGGGSSSSNDPEPMDALLRLDATLTKASRDLYRAYTILHNAAQRLNLPDRVTNEVTSVMCRYAARRDGLIVRGVSTQLKKLQQQHQQYNNKSKSKMMHHHHHQRSRSNSIVSEADKQALDALREYNILKQIGSLTAGLLFYTCRNLGWPRSMVQVCESIQPAASTSSSATVAATATIALACPSQQQQLHTRIQKEGDQFVQKKHCSRAMSEIKETFPEYAQAMMTNSASAVVSSYIDNNTCPAAAASAEGNFVEHAIRNLRLPPVAEASVRALVFYCRKQSWSTTSTTASSNFSTVCAAVTYFVCLSGETMQRLALQSTKKQLRPSMSFLQARKRFKFSKHQEIVQVQEQQQHDYISKAPPSVTVVKDPPLTSTVVNDPSRAAVYLPTSVTAEEKMDDDPLVLVDNSSHSLLLQNEEHQHASDEQRAYEMRRIWDAWKEQTPWRRTKAEIEQSCGVSRMVVNDFFKTHLFPQRFSLLKVLETAASSTHECNANGCTTCPVHSSSESISLFLKQTPLASVLLPHIMLAAPVLKEECN
jgi:transcription initiation factor TFIIIB Brf1 subunit/transcription initiation factor TFIIB